MHVSGAAMGRVEHNAQEMRALIEEINHQFRMVDDLVKLDGPHAQLSLQELRVLEHLGDRGPRMMRELAEYLLLAGNSVTSVIDNLERKGQVQRVRSEEDRRVVRVELTAAGRDSYDACVGEKLGFMRKMLNALTEDEQEIFLLLIRKMARAGHQRIRSDL
jgi:DNA-binding MarR family transcriptional regulator